MNLLLLARALASTPVVAWDLEQDDGGWAAGGELGQWSWGKVVAGPGAGFDGENAWAIGLDGAYLNDSVETLEVPMPSLAGLARPMFSFQHWYALGPGDYGTVEVDEGGGWHALTPVYGYSGALGWSGSSGGWQPASVELPAGAPVLRLRWVFAADVAGVGVGWFVDQAGVWDGDVTSPQIDELELLGDTEDLEGPYRVHVTAQDDTDVAGVSLAWAATTGDSGTVAMQAADGGWVGEIPGQPAGTVVEYHVTASDGANTTRAPARAEADFRVYLAAPTDLVGPSGRVVAQEAQLSWTAPISIHTVQRYEVVRADAVVATSSTLTATVPLSGNLDVFAVRAVYDEGAGDLSESFAVNGAVPQLLGVDPAEGYPGEALRVTVAGQDALFVTGEVTADFGNAISVGAITVRDVDRFVAELEIDAGAAAGSWTVSVESAAGTLELPAGFTVLDAADRPRILGLEPGQITQGDSATVRIALSKAPAGMPSVAFGEGVVVESVALEGSDVVVALSVASNAPIGAHAITVDDGVRVLDGASLEVKDWSPAPIQACSTGAGAPGVALAGAGVLAVLRRRR